MDAKITQMNDYHEHMTRESHQDPQRIAPRHVKAKLSITVIFPVRGMASHRDVDSHILQTNQRGLKK